MQKTYYLTCVKCGSDKFIRSVEEENVTVRILRKTNAFIDEEVGSWKTLYRYHCAKCGRERVFEAV